MNITEKIKSVLPKLQGWCCEEKATKLASFIIEEDLKLMVEIGVFGGSSLVPQILAAKKTKGHVYGIDPWKNNDALEGMIAEEHKEWWTKIDLNKIYNGLVNFINQNQLNPNVTLIQNKAENVVGRFEDASIDLLHIDGNHSEELAYKDAVLYYPKVKKNGLIFFDDIFWTEDGNVTTRKAIMYLMENNCEKIDVINNDCMVLRKN